MRKLGLLAALMLLAANVFAQSARPPFLPIWASGATPTTDIVQPSNSFITQGWPLSSTPPSRQYFNWILNRSSWGVDYLLHRGIADWDASTTYSIGDIVNAPNVGSGTLYRSAVNNNTGNNPGTTPLGQFWDTPKVPDPSVGAYEASGHIATTNWLAQNYIKNGDPFSKLGGSILSSQVPLAAVNQYQSFLSISYGQLTGVPVSTVGGTPNTIVARDGSGYIYTNYLNQSSPANENPFISQVMVTNGTDNFVRKENFVNFQAQMQLSNIGGGVTPGQVPAGAVTQYAPQVFQYNPFQSQGSDGCTTIPGGVIIMWGQMNPNGGTILVVFPCGGFPHGVFSVVGNGSSVPTQTNVISWNAANFTVHNTGGSGNYIAIGY